MKRTAALLLITALLAGCTPGASPKPQPTSPPPAVNTPASPTTTQTPTNVTSPGATPATAPEQLHPADPDHIVSLGVTDLTAHGRKTTTDPSQIAQIMAVLNSGKFVGPVNRTDATPANGYSIVLNLDNKQFRSMEYWPGASPYNIADIDNQQYWSVPSLDEAMKPLLPPTYISADAVRAIAAKLDPRAEWSPRFQAKGSFSVDGDFVWVANGFEPGGLRVAYYLHPVTGAILKAEPPETTAPAEEAVRDFYGLMAKGDYENGWNLVYSTARNPNPNTAEAGRKSQFLDRAGKRQWSLAKVESAQWNRDYYKYYECQCGVFDVVMVNVSLSDGASQRVPVAKDADGVWRILWSAFD